MNEYGLTEGEPKVEEPAIRVEEAGACIKGYLPPWISDAAADNGSVPDNVLDNEQRKNAQQACSLSHCSATPGIKSDLASEFGTAYATTNVLFL